MVLPWDFDRHKLLDVVFLQCRLDALLERLVIGDNVADVYK